MLYETYVEGYKLAQQGRPTLIYPTGTHELLGDFGERMGIGSEVAAFAAEHGVELSTRIWVPGSLMSYRDVVPMLECLFLVNKLPGGEGHHDGHMKGRDAAQVLSNPMFQKTAAADQALAMLRQDEKRQVETRARPAPGSRNLVLPESMRGKRSACPRWAQAKARALGPRLRTQRWPRIFPTMSSSLAATSILRPSWRRRAVSWPRITNSR